MIIEPQTKIKLLKCPLEEDQNHQLTFENLQAQQAYFNGLPKLELGIATYQRKDGVLRFEANFDEALQYNYCMYQNKAYSDKWFYAFITNMIYLGNEVVGVELKTDVFQTWQFDFVWKECFVEREHVRDDTPGRHTIPEDVELGPYVQCLPTAAIEDQNKIIVFQVSEVIPALNIPSNVSQYGLDYAGVFSGLMMFGVRSYDAAQNVVYNYAKAGKPDAIQAVFMAPEMAAPAGATSTTPEGKTIQWFYETAYANRKTKITVPTPSQLGAMNRDYLGKWTPKNNKLLTYPYCYFVGTNNVGTSKIYKYEDFKDRKPQFDALFVLGQGCSGIARPRNNYKGSIEDDEDGVYTTGKGVWDEGITFPKYPICAWASDYYLNWLTQNAVNIPLQLASGAMSLVGSVASGNIGGAASALFNMIAEPMSQAYQAQLIPDEAKGNPNGSDINWASQMRGVYFTGYSIKYEYAQMIDDFFTMFGYKVNSMQVPYINIRPNFDFCKTRGCMIEGNVPQADLNEMKQIMDKGITFWHHPETFLDYSQPNARV